jgi:hypothetical protein
MSFSWSAASRWTPSKPLRRAEDALGGSATFFTAAASCFCPVQLVGVVGDDFPPEGSLPRTSATWT